MAEQKGAKRPPQSLEDKALQALARKAGGKEIDLAPAERGVVPSTGKTLSRFRASRTGEPNAEHFTVVLDEDGAEIDLGTLSESDRRALFPPPSFTIDRRELGLTSPPSGIKITPPFNDLVLEPDDTLHEVITVTVPAGVAKADVYFLADTTFSMGRILGAVQSGANSMLAALQSPGFDIAFGVGNYKDFPVPDPNPYAFQHQQSLTQATADVVKAINDWKATDGKDGSEGQLFALNRLAEPAFGTIGWRGNSKRIIVWFGDAPGHDPVCNGISSAGFDVTEVSVTKELIDEHITVIAISTPTSTFYPNALDDNPKKDANDYDGICPIGGSPGQATRITAATGGIHVSGIDPTTIVKTIIDLVMKAIEIKNLSLVATGGTKPFVVSISPAAGYGPLAGDREHVLFFDVDFKGVRPCTGVEQVFTGTFDAVADGVVVAQKPVRIAVPPCRIYSYSVKFVCGVQEDCTCEEGPVRPGVYATEINIYNDGDKETPVEKWVVPIVFAGAAAGREPRVVQPRARDFILLPPKSATMDDCHRLGELLFGAHPASPLPLTLGFLEIASHQPLNVVAVYTAAGLAGGPVSIEVETVQPRLKRGLLRGSIPTTVPTHHT